MDAAAYVQRVTSMQRQRGSGRPWASIALGAVCALMLIACDPPQSELQIAETYNVDMFFLRCGAQGEACCRAPAASQNVPAFGPLVACNTGLGCDIVTNTCVSPCGGSGQVCCDGPETRAPKWTADGKVYSPNYWNMLEMCRNGACERQSHRCFSCGTEDGQPCCPPDAAQATARCIGDNIECDFDPRGHYESGTCRRCGILQRAPCPWGCEGELGVLHGLCAACGAQNQPPCDKGCKAGLGLAQGLCRVCGNAGQPPCDNGCLGGLKLRNGVCAACGGQNQAPCDAGCGPGTRLINSACVPCGLEAQPPCLSGCVHPRKVAGGVCRLCGSNGQQPCDVGCDPGLVLSGGRCITPPNAPPPDPCAQAGQSCVASNVQGTQCCQTGAPLLCVWSQCRACVPHGQECTAGGTQTCCNAKDGDQCVLDVGSGKAVCDIPD